MEVVVVCVVEGAVSSVLPVLLLPECELDYDV